MSFNCPMKAAGFTPQQIRDALEFCDNDRERVSAVMLHGVRVARGIPVYKSARTCFLCPSAVASLASCCCAGTRALQSLSWLKKQQKSGGKLQWNEYVQLIHA